MSHLRDNNIGYFEHLKFAWCVAFVLVVHGMFPNIWKEKASQLLCDKE
jgi:hypothetical protein